MTPLTLNLALAAIIVVLVAGCGDDDKQDAPFTRSQAERIVQHDGYKVIRCYPEIGGNYDCQTAGNVWVHVRESGVAFLIDAPDESFVPTPSPTPTPTPDTTFP